MRPKAPRMGDKCGRQTGDKSKITRPRPPRAGDKWETSVRACGPEHHRVGGNCRRQVGDKCKIMRPRAAREKKKRGRQAEHKCKITPPRAFRVENKWETSGKPWGADCPESETSGRQASNHRPRAFRAATKCGRQVEDTCKIMRPRAPRAPRAGDRRGRHM